MKKTFSIALLLIAAAITTAQAAQVTLAWDAPAAGTRPTGYRIYQRTGAAFDYTKPLWEGAATTCKVTVPDESESAFVVRAYAKGALSGTVQESGDSNEVIAALPPPQAPRNLLLQAIDEIIQGLSTLKKAVAAQQGGA